MDLVKQSISYEFKTLAIEGFALPEGLVQNVLQQFQPRIELNRFKFPFTLDSITVGDRKIFVKGKAKKLDLNSISIPIKEDEPNKKIAPIETKTLQKEVKIEK